MDCGPECGPPRGRIAGPRRRLGVLFDDDHRQAWLCAGDGLAILPEGSDELKHLGVAEGACLGPVLDGAKLGGKFYFASGAMMPVGDCRFTIRSTSGSPRFPARMDLIQTR